MEPPEEGEGVSLSSFSLRLIKAADPGALIFPLIGHYSLRLVTVVTLLSPPHCFPVPFLLSSSSG